LATSTSASRFEVGIAVVHQHLHARAALVGKQVATAPGYHLTCNRLQGKLMADGKASAGKATPIPVALVQYLMFGGLVAYAWYAYGLAGTALPALLLLPAAALLLPPLQKRIGLTLGLGLSVGLSLAFLTGIALWGGWIKQERQATEQSKREQDSATRIAKLKEERAADYTANKTKILAEIESQLASNQSREAAATISKFMTVTKDPDLGRLQYRAELQVMRLDLQDEAKLSLERRQQIYSTLAKEDIANRATYEQKLKEVSTKIEEKRAQQEQESKRVAMEASVKGQFSAYDGSHRQVEAAIKARLKDPSSYEHVETRYAVNPTSITVYTTYRAKNSFNAVVPGTAVATVDASGNVISLN